MMPTIEPGPDATVIVTGVPLDEVRRKLIRRPPGRPRAPEITEADIRSAVAELCEFDVEWTRVNLAAALDTSPRRIRDAVGRLYGGWTKLSEFRRAWHPYRGIHEDHRRDAA